jgi:hypothetical protein
MAYALDWVPPQIWDSAQNRWRKVLDAVPYANPNKGDFARTATSQDFAGDAFTNTSDRYIAIKRFSFLARGLDPTSIELPATTADSIDLLEFLLVEFKLGTTEQILQKRPVRISTLLEGRDEHWYDVAATPVILPPSGNFRAAISAELPSTAFGGAGVTASVRVYLTALGAMLRAE